MDIATSDQSGFSRKHNILFSSILLKSVTHSCFITVVDGTELGPVYAVLVVKEFSNLNYIIK